MRRRQLVECRQLLDAGRAPGCPQVEQDWLTREVLQAERRTVEVYESRCGRGGALVATVDALLRSRLRGRRGLVGRLLRRLVAGGEGGGGRAGGDQAPRAPLAQA